MTFLKGHNSLATDSKDTVENKMVGKEFKRVIFKKIKKYKKKLNSLTIIIKFIK